MIDEKKLYVIKFGDGSYYTGFNGTSKQLRQAKIYVSLKHIKGAIKYKGYEDYKIIEVEIKEVGEVYGN